MGWESEPPGHRDGDAVTPGPEITEGRGRKSRRGDQREVSELDVTRGGGVCEWLQCMWTKAGAEEGQDLGEATREGKGTACVGVDSTKVLPGRDGSKGGGGQLTPSPMTGGAAEATEVWTVRAASALSRQSRPGSSEEAV